MNFFCLFFCTKNTSTKTRRCWVHSAEKKGWGVPLRGFWEGRRLKIGKKMKGKSQMDWGKWEEETEGQTDGHWGGDTIWVLFGAPVPGGTRGDCPCGSTRVHPLPPRFGVILSKMVFFQPKLRPEKRGAAPTSPSASRGSPMSLWGIWGAESSKPGGCYRAGGG